MEHEFSSEASTHPIILFDGVCNLCNSSVQFILKRDGTGKFRFSSLQSEFSKEMLKRYNLPVDYLESIILLHNGKIYTSSDAVIEILNHLGGFYKLFSVFKIIPKFLREPLYKFIARNRYRWFGRKDSCMVPEARFVFSPLL